MNTYTFDIEFPDGEILRDIVVAASRFTAEWIISEEHPDAVNINFITVE